MRSFVVVLCAALFLSSLPGPGSAQDLSATGVARGLFALPFRDGAVMSPRVYLGWLEHPTGMTLTMHRTNKDGVASWPVKGLWAGLETGLALSENLGLLVSGGVLLSQRASGNLLWSDGRADAFHVEGYQAGHVQGLLSYQAAGPVQVLAGFRWDHSSTRLLYWDSTPDDYILNAYLPLVGLQVDQQFFAGDLRVRCVGFAAVPGSLKYHYWDGAYSEFGDFDLGRGYFLDIFTEYSKSLMGDFRVGAFLSWNVVHAQSREELLSGSTHEPISWSADKRSWILGASIALNFVGPL